MSETNDETRQLHEQIPPTHDMRCAFALGRVLGAMDVLKERSDQVVNAFGSNVETKVMGDLINSAHARTVEACEEAGFDTTLTRAKAATNAPNQ